MGIYTPLVLEEWVEKAFYHGLRTNGFVILAGQTGTGKTRLFHDFEVYDSDEFIRLLKKVYDRKKDYWTKIMDLRDWIINEFGKNLTLERYLLPIGSSGDFSDTFTAKLRGADPGNVQIRKNEWIKKVYKLEITDFGLSGQISYFVGSGSGNDYYLSEELAEDFPDYCESSVSSETETDRSMPLGVRFLSRPHEFFNDVMKDILKDLIRKIENRDIIGIINMKNDEKLKKFFSDKALKLLAFIADPCRYWKIFDKNEIEEIKRNLYEIRTEEEQSQGGERDELHDDPTSIEKLFFPIRPDFTEPHHLVGYYNPIDKKYYPTELVRFILKAIEEYLEHGECARPYLVLFDEMNIAQVEYYFADFLSVLETPRIDDVSKYRKEIIEFRKSLQEMAEFQESLQGISQCPEERFRGFTSKGITLYNIPEKTVKILLPPNLYFVGTVNMDETTRSFSPKVLDRAFVTEFDSDLEMFIEERYSSPQNSQRSPEGQQSSENPNDNQSIRICKYDFTRWGRFSGIDREKIKELLSSEPDIKETIETMRKIYKTLKRYGLHFGYRTFEHVMMFIVNAKDTKYDELRIDNTTKALDIAIYTKVLPKFSGSRSQLERPLSELLVELCDTVVKGEDNSGRFRYENNQLFWEKLNQNSQSEQENREPVIIETLPEKENNGIKLNDYEIKTEYPLTVKKILEMLYRLRKEGFASFL